MTQTFVREQFIGQLDRLIRLWSGAKDISAEALFTPGMTFSSSARGELHGADKVAALLKDDLKGLDESSLVLSNLIVRADENNAVAGAYLLGNVSDFSQAGKEKSAMFGGVILVAYDRTGEALRISDVKIQINWLKGSQALLTHWQLPTEKNWQPGDAPAVIVSELDSPWRRVPVSTLPGDEDTFIAEAWYRYAWGLDLADYAQFAECFSEDVGAELTPMGTMQGRRVLAGTLKAFRMPWPWIQHYGTPLQINLNTDGETASMILGRIIPEQTELEGEKVYGAHYRIELIKKAQGHWQMSWMGYHPGWLTAQYEQSSRF